MSKVYVYCEKNGFVPFFSFYEKLDIKLQQKIWKGIRCLAIFPSYHTEPHVKHFTTERYINLYEYRERIRVLFRVIFAFDSEKNIILLAPFIKQRDRDTYKALEHSLQMLADIKQYPECKIELLLGKEDLTGVGHNV